MFSIREIQFLIDDRNHQLEHILQHLASLYDISLFYPILSKHIIVHLFAHEELVYEPGEECPKAMLG